MVFKNTPSPFLKVCVIIPVKNEEEIIIQTLDALRNQKDASGLPLNTQLYEVLILANNCSDKTYSLIKDYQNAYPRFPLLVEEIIFPKGKANIGTARRFLMDIAHHRFSYLKKPDGIIASTDGDTQVDEYWVSKIIAEMKKGCDVLGGKILSNLENCPARIYHLRDIRYQNLIAKIESIIDPQPHNPWPSHFQCFGANFSITCYMYALAGRLPQIPFLEDVAFVKALELKDAKIRKSPYVKVYTSARRLGRVEKGFSQQLAWFESLESEKQEHLVECAESIISRIKIRKLLRNYWINCKLNEIQTLFTTELQMPFKEEDLQQWFIESVYFGEFFSKAQADLIKGNWYNQWKLVTIKKALKDLRIEISKIAEQRFHKTEVETLQYSKNGSSG